MNWLSRFLPGSGPGLSPEQQASLDLAGKLPAPDLARSHYETRYVVVNTETGPQCAAAGADWLVTGSALFKAKDPAAVIDTLHGSH